MEPDVNPATAASERMYKAVEAAPVIRVEHRESRVTRLVEQQAAKIPSDVFLFLSLGSMAASATFEVLRRDRLARFVGSWVTPLLVMGVYNKLVKTFGAR